MTIIAWMNIMAFMSLAWIVYEFRLAFREYYFGEYVAWREDPNQRKAKVAVKALHRAGRALALAAFDILLTAGMALVGSIVSLIPTISGTSVLGVSLVLSIFIAIRRYKSSKEEARATLLRDELVVQEMKAREKYNPEKWKRFIKAIQPLIDRYNVSPYTMEWAHYERVRIECENSPKDLEELERIYLSTKNMLDEKARADKRAYETYMLVFKARKEKRVAYEASHVAFLRWLKVVKRITHLTGTKADVQNFTAADVCQRAKAVDDLEPNEREARGTFTPHYDR